MLCLKFDQALESNDSHDDLHEAILLLVPPGFKLSETGERSAKRRAAAGDTGESRNQRTHPESQGGQGYGQEGGTEA